MIKDIDFEDMTYEEQEICKLREENKRLRSQLTTLKKTNCEYKNAKLQAENKNYYSSYLRLCKEMEQLNDKLIRSKEKNVVPKIESDNAGIYRIYNKFTNESYIGQSLNVYERIRDHYNSYDSDISDWHYDLSHNPQDYEWEVLKEGVRYQHDLDRLEVYYMGKYDSIENGYNKYLAPRYHVVP